MTFLYLLIALLVLWLLWRGFHNASTPDSHPQAPSIKVVTRHIDKVDNTDDKDNWEGSFWEVEEPFPVKATLRINYEDGDDQQTERTVDVRQFGSYGPSSLLIGHCKMRNATRTFRADRIKRCVDEETGEVVSDVAQYLKAKYENSPEHTRDKLYEEEYDTLRILLYVGKADGQLRAAEKAIIRDTCRGLAKDSRITDDLIDEIFSSLDVPTIQAFKLAVGRLVGKPLDERLMLFKSAQDMVKTQKTVHPSEQEALDYMEKRLAIFAAT